MNRFTRLALAGFVLAVAVPARAGEVRVSFSNGRVTVVATDASPRQILAEWARQGQVRVSNLDSLTGGPVTLQLIDVSESQALETLLRGAAGYVAAPRAEPADTASTYDRILLLRGVVPAVASAAATSATARPTAAGDDGYGRGRAVRRPDPTNPDADGNEYAAPTLPGGGPTHAPYPPPAGATMPGWPTAPGTAPQAGFPAAAWPLAPMAGSPSPAPGLPSGNAAQPQPRGSASQAATQDGAAAPGLPTAPPAQQPQPAPYQGYGQDAAPAAQNPASASQPGMPTATTSQPSTTLPGQASTPVAPVFRNPYGLSEPVNAPVTSPDATPYGLGSAAKPGTPTTPPKTDPGKGTTPPKAPGGPGGPGGN